MLKSGKICKNTLYIKFEYYIFYVVSLTEDTTIYVYFPGCLAATDKAFWDTGCMTMYNDCTVASTAERRAHLKGGFGTSFEMAFKCRLMAADPELTQSQ